MSHLKRYEMPKFWSVPIKEQKFVVRPLPGPHAKDKCIPLIVLVRDVLKLAENYKEAKKIISKGIILIDKKEKKEAKAPLGLMDVIEIPKMKKYYRIYTDKKGLYPKEIKSSDAGSKLCKIINKTIVKKGKTQINLHDGRNILTDKKDYKTGDTIMISLPDQKITGHFRLEEGSQALIYDGKNKGTIGKIKNIRTKNQMTETSTVTLDVGGKEMVTLKDYILVLPQKGVKNEPNEKNQA